jgi:protein-S-isoprenylcysteine O-methyltransferase Ste14
MIDPSLLVRALGLYVPLLLAVAIGRWRLRSQQHLAAILAGLCWSFPCLLELQILNCQFHWWTFHAQSGLIRGMPVDLYIGWAILWGVLPVMVFPRAPSWIVTLIFVSLDLVVMPACSPVVSLSDRWLVGEFAGVILVLLPALVFGRLSWERTNLRARVIFWIIAFSAVIFFLIPETIFAIVGHIDWSPVLAGSPWTRNLRLQGMVILGVAALSAAQEFALRGLGTPIPFDPPSRLVTSGLYRYLANPMQASGSLAMTAWGLMLKSPWLAAAGPVTLVYCVGLAHWHEDLNMRERFGDAWLHYRCNVPAWWPRWRPWHDPEASPALLYIAAGCRPCSEVRRWFERQAPFALALVAAEEHPSRDLTRITYDPMDGTPEEEGVAAIARGLEHINLGWAFAGACLRLPGARWLAQLLVDAAGFGPRLVERGSCRISSTSPTRPQI